MGFTPFWFSGLRDVIMIRALLTVQWRVWAAAPSGACQSIVTVRRSCLRAATKRKMRASRQKRCCPNLYNIVVTRVLAWDAMFDQTTSVHNAKICLQCTDVAKMLFKTHLCHKTCFALLQLARPMYQISKCDKMKIVIYSCTCSRRVFAWLSRVLHYCCNSFVSLTYCSLVLQDNNSRFLNLAAHHVANALPALWSRYCYMKLASQLGWRREISSRFEAFYRR